MSEPVVTTTSNSAVTYFAIDPPTCLTCGTLLDTVISMDRVHAGVGGPRPYFICPVCP